MSAVPAGAQGMRESAGIDQIGASAYQHCTAVRPGQVAPVNLFSIPIILGPDISGLLFLQPHSWPNERGPKSGY